MYNDFTAKTNPYNTNTTVKEYETTADFPIHMNGCAICCIKSII